MARQIAGLAAVDARYQVLLCDVWGVIHNGRTPFAPACQALHQWRLERGPVVLISNSPRPAAEVIRQLDEIGVPRTAWSDIVTSGDVTRALLAARGPCAVYRIGPNRDEALYAGLPLNFTSIESASVIACTGPNDDEVETPEDYRPLLARGVALRLDMICANPDIIVQRGERLIYCAGALAELYDKLGGRVMMAGKPFAPIYEASLAMARSLLGAEVSEQNVLAIGDGLATDLKGAQSQRLDALFVASGIHAAAVCDADGNLDVGKVENLLSSEGAVAAYVMSSLAW